MAAGAEINSYKPTSEDSSARRLRLGVGPLQFRGSVEMRAAPRSLQALGWTSQMADRFSAETEQGLLPESFYSEAVAAIIVTFHSGSVARRINLLLPFKLEGQVDTLPTSFGL
jgi:hypothetical protein